MSLPHQAFWFVRHGETDWNAQGRSQGRTDVALNANGIAQAHAASALLRGRAIASVVCSPLSRARDTAEIIATAIAAPVTVQEDLREVSFGVHEGSPMAGAWFADWIEKALTPQGAESFAALRTRASAAFGAALAHPAPVLVVAHGALFRALRAEMGLAPDVRTANAMPLFCAPGAPGAPWTLTPAEQIEQPAPQPP